MNRRPNSAELNEALNGADRERIAELKRRRAKLKRLDIRLTHKIQAIQATIRSRSVAYRAVAKASRNKRNNKPA